MQGRLGRREVRRTVAFGQAVPVTSQLLHLVQTHDENVDKVARLETVDCNFDQWAVEQGLN